MKGIDMNLKNANFSTSPVRMSQDRYPFECNIRPYTVLYLHKTVMMQRNKSPTSYNNGD